MEEKYKVDEIEFEMTHFLLVNNLPFSMTEPLLKFSQALKEKELDRYLHITNITRQKASIIASEGIGPQLKEDIRKIIDNQPYSLIGSDKFGKTFLAISIRYMEENLPFSKMYALIALTDDYTGKKLAEIVNKEVLTTEEPRRNLIGVVSDGAGNMRGPEKGLVSRLQKALPHILSYHCVCHCLALVNEKASRDSLGTLITLVKEISSTFAFSKKKNLNLEQFRVAWKEIQKRF